MHNMKKITRLFLSLIVTIVFASCTTTKDIYMFRETAGGL